MTVHLAVELITEVRCLPRARVVASGPIARLRQQRGVAVTVPARYRLQCLDRTVLTPVLHSVDH
jgi:hypothetical protein